MEHYWFARPPLRTRRFPGSGDAATRLTRCLAVDNAMRRPSSALSQTPIIHSWCGLWLTSSPSARRFAGRVLSRQRHGVARSGTTSPQLAGALRAAKRAHGAYVAELRQADVEPAEDWSMWDAEYLFGQC